MFDSSNTLSARMPRSYESAGLGGCRQGSPEDGVGPGACFVGGCAVSFDQGGDGGAFGEEHPLVGDDVGVFGTGRFGQGAEVAAAPGLVCHHGFPGRMLGAGEFDGGVDEGAAAEVAPAEPLVEDVEYGEQAAVGVLGAGLDLVDEPGEEALVECVQARGEQLVFGPVVLVDGDLGDRRCGSDLVDADCPYPPAVKEPGCGVEVPGVRGGLWLPVLVGASVHRCLLGWRAVDRRGGFVRLGNYTN